MDTLGRFGELARTSEPALDLGHAAFLIAQIEHPDLEPERELTRLDALAARVGQGDVHHLRRELFEKEGFAGNADDYYDPRNSCLNDVLDRRLGIPITLSILAMEVGRRLGLTVRGIGLPGHFMVAADGVLFDPFNGGAAVSRDEAAAVVARVLGKPQVARDVLEGLMLHRGLRRTFPRQVDCGKYMAMAPSPTAASSPCTPKSLCPTTLFVKTKAGMAAACAFVTLPLWMMVLWSTVTASAPAPILRNAPSPPHSAPETCAKRLLRIVMRRPLTSVGAAA